VNIFPTTVYDSTISYLGGARGWTGRALGSASVVRVGCNGKGADVGGQISDCSQGYHVDSCLHLVCGRVRGSGDGEGVGVGIGVAGWVRKKFCGGS
jgi:hypothetical protein